MGSQPNGGQRTGSSCPTLRILDLCTGTGCIPLLLHALLSQQFPGVQCVGVDVEPRAIRLARENLKSNTLQGSLRPEVRHDVCFLRADVLAEREPSALSNQRRPAPSLSQALGEHPEFDILVSNPPYISPHGFNISTSRSVRNWEPKLALVPQAADDAPAEQPATLVEDTFYPHLLATASHVKAKIVLLEVADLAQALRVASLAKRIEEWEGVEIWRDWPSATTCVMSDERETVEGMGRGIEIVGEGNGRAVLCWRGVGARWLGK